MKYLLIIVPAAALLLMLPFIRCFLKRLSLYFGIKSVCGKQGMTFVPAHPFWIFGNIKSGRCDFHIVGGSILYRVKLAGSISRNNLYSFRNSGIYLVRPLMWAISYTRHAIKYEAKNKRPFDFEYGMRDEWRGHEITDILLFNPAPGGVSISMKDGTMKGIGNGDYTGEAYFYNKTGFLKLLKSKCVSDSEQSQSLLTEAE